MQKRFFLFLLFFIITFKINCENKQGWINTNIKGNVLAIKPSEKDDFYQSINYERFNNYSNIRVESTGYDEIAKIITEDFRKLNKLANIDIDSEKKKFVDLYRMVTDWESRDSNDMKPILSTMKKIQSINNLNEITERFADEQARLFFPLKLNLKNTNGFFYVPEIEISFLFVKEVEFYFDFYNHILGKFGYTEKEIKQLVMDAYNFENLYAKKLKEENTYYSQFIYANKIKQEYQNLPLTDYLYYSGIPNLTYKIKFSEEMEILDSIFDEEHIEAIKALWICKLLLNSAPLLDRETYKQYLILNEKLYGQLTSIYDEDISVQILNTYIPEFVGKIWCTEFCSEIVFKEVELLAKEILEQYKQTISSWTWLNIGSRYNLIELLNQTKVIVGHARLNDYSKLELTEDFYSSMMNVITYEKRLYAKKCFQSFDRYEWMVAPQVSNAFYNEVDNTINITAGYIYGIKYNSSLSKEEIFGSLGYVIAHEISHIFCLPDENGMILQQLNETDHDELDKRLTLLANYFSTFEILDGIKCNGSLCKSEIGADFFGLNVILKLAKGYKDFDYKLLFKTIAENNFYTTSEQIIRINHIKDFHPPNYLRVNAIVQQFDEFYEAYNIKWWDGMYLAPKKRIRLGK